jgi:conjugal transfer/entry exclusion protein
LLEPYKAVLTEPLSNSPSITWKELQAWLESEQGLSISISAIDKFLRHKLCYRYIKSEQSRDDLAAAREHWQACQQSCDLSKRVFLDETRARADRMRCYGRALAGTRCKDTAPPAMGKR